MQIITRDTRFVITLSIDSLITFEDLDQLISTLTFVEKETKWEHRIKQKVIPESDSLISTWRLEPISCEMTHWWIDYPEIKLRSFDHDQIVIFDAIAVNQPFKNTNRFLVFQSAN